MRPFLRPIRPWSAARCSPATSCWSRVTRRLSAIIKFLTQSTWSHAALYVGERPGDIAPNGEPNVLLEAEADTGVVTVPLSKYVGFNIRICRPCGLDVQSKQKVIDYALARIGKLYDSKQIVDLARYLFPYPPVPTWFRRRMLAIGSRRSDQGDLLDADRGSVRLDPLSDPAGTSFDQRQDLWRCALCEERERPYPQARAVHAARFRCFAVFRHRQTHHRCRVRLSHGGVGAAGASRRRI